MRIRLLLSIYLLFGLTLLTYQVHSQTVEGGTVMTEDSMTMVYTCPGDGINDIISFDSTTNGTANYQYVITDNDNIILGLPPSDMQNFEGAGEGICRVWGLSYTGMLIAEAGDTASTEDLSDGMFDLSDNYITVIRDQPDTPTVQTEAGETMVYTCPGDGQDDIVHFDSTSSSMANFNYVITDEDLNILGLPPSDMQNFEGAGEGICLVWGLSYTGNLTAEMGDNAGMVDLSDDCYQLSSNYITVVRDQPNVTTVQTEAGDTSIVTCPGDGTDDIVQFDSIGNSSANFVYIITDTLGNVLGIPPSDMQNFEGAGEGVCLVWGLSYTGNLTVEMGDNLNQIDELSDDCFELSSNVIRVIRDPQHPDCQTAVERIDGREIIKVYPQPASTQLHIEILDETFIQDSKLMISTVHGRIVAQSEPNTSRPFTLDIEDLPAGIYLLHLISDRRMASRKLVIQ